MKYLPKALVLAAMLAIPFGAEAAEFNNPPVVSSVYGSLSPFSGFYAGAGLNTAWLKTTTSPYAWTSPAFPVSYSQPGSTSLGANLQLGYNYFYGPALAGVEFSTIWNNHTATAAEPFSNAYVNFGTMRTNWALDLNSRFGITTIGGSVPYIIGGFGLHQVAFGAPELGAPGLSRWYGVWNLGAGVEIPVVNKVSLKTQYIFDQSFQRNIQDQNLSMTGVYHF